MQSAALISEPSAVQLELSLFWIPLEKEASADADGAAAEAAPERAAAGAVKTDVTGVAVDTDRTLATESAVYGDEGIAGDSAV